MLSQLNGNEKIRLSESQSIPQYVETVFHYIISKIDEVSADDLSRIVSESSTNDQEKIARSILTIRRISVALGVLGMLVVFLSRYYISRVTFGTAEDASIEMDRKHSNWE